MELNNPKITFHVFLLAFVTNENFRDDCLDFAMHATLVDAEGVLVLGDEAAVERVAFEIDLGIVVVVQRLDMSPEHIVAFE